jgi:hypothetical protein
MKLFISYRHSDSSIVGEVFEYLGKAGLDCSFPKVSHTTSDCFRSSISDALKRQRIVIAMFSALEIYERRQPARRKLSLVKAPFYASRLFSSDSCSDASREEDYCSDPYVMAYGHLSSLRDGSTGFPFIRVSSVLPDWPATLGDIEHPALSGRAPFHSEIAKSIVLAGRRFDVGDEVIEPGSFHIDIDYRRLSAAGIDWPGEEFILQMHSDSIRDGAGTLLSAWRRTADPLNSGIFLTKSWGVSKTYQISPYPMLPEQKADGAWPAWLQCLFRFRIRERRKDNRRTYVYSIAQTKKIGKFAGQHIWSKYRRVGSRLQTLGQLFMGGERTLGTGWDLRQRTEQLAYNRLALLPARRSPLLTDAHTVYALYRGSCRLRLGNGSCE